VKLKVNVGSLGEVCDQASLTLDRQASNPLGNMYLRAAKKEEEGFLYAYSNNLTAECMIKIPAEVEEEGEVLIHPARVKDFLMGRPKDAQVTLSSTEKKLRIQFGASHASIGLHVQPEIPANLMKALPFKEKPLFTVKGADLAEFVRRSMFCIPPDDNGQAGQIIGGMYFTADETGYEVQATDGAIAAQVKVVGEKGEGFVPFMLPLAALQPLSRIVAGRRSEDISLISGLTGQYGMSTIYFRFGDVMFGSRLLHGKFPGLKTIIDSVKPEFNFTVDRNELKNALTRCAAFLVSRSRVVKIEVKKESLDLKIGGDVDAIDDKVAITQLDGFEGSTKLAIGLDYLLNISNGSHATLLNVGASGGLKPLLVSDESDERVKSKYVLMQVKV
jgi:DNA polymerase III sliding clamp (beta) subunit (PCNA family)